MKPKEKELQREIETCLFFDWMSRHRSCPEKRFAHALLVGGVTDVRLSASYWGGQPPNIDGCMVNHLSIETTEGTRIGADPLLWFILRRLKVPFSGGSDGCGRAQASWHPESDKAKDIVIPYNNLSLPMVVCYFNVMKELEE